MKVSVIIASSRAHEVKDAVAALTRQTAPKDSFEVIIVLDKQSVLSLPPSALGLLIVSADDPHPSVKRNLGARQAHGQILAFIDDDVVPPVSWVEEIIKSVNPDTLEVWGGPNRDERQSWQYRIAQKVQENPLLEGLRSHRFVNTKVEVGIHDVPLCNLIVSRKLFDRLGGFSSKISYFLDDVDFNYRAKEIGAKLYLSSRLSVHHALRPLILPYLAYKFRTRYMIGRLYQDAPHFYADSTQLKIVHLSWILVPLSIGIACFVPLMQRILMGSGIVYVLGVYVSSCSMSRNLADILAAPIFLFLAHLCSYIGYTMGRLVSVRIPAR